MYDRGELDQTDESGMVEELPDDFWEKAVVVEPPPRSVHLKLDPEVFHFFKAGGKGHLTRMQNVLKAYVKAQKARGHQP